MPIVSNDFSDIVYNRRSIRKFDTSVKIPREEMLEILDKTVTAPSSVNMQPWRYAVQASGDHRCTCQSNCLGRPAWRSRT